MTNSIDTFPFPFSDSQYHYQNGSTLLYPARCVAITENYHDEIDLKRKLLQDHHSRCYQSSSQSFEAQWEILYTIFHELARYEPENFSLVKMGKEWIFQNHLLNEEERLIYRDSSSIEIEPLDLVGRHVQEDLILMGDRHGDLFLDAGQLCFPSNWSLSDKYRQDFKLIHQPVPGIDRNQFIQKVARFIQRIQPGHSWERKNWSITIDRQLDTPQETFNEWGKKRNEITPENAGERIHLRVEVQRLYRLPINNDVLFTIHTHLRSLEELAARNKWLHIFYENIKSLDEDIADYKGISSYREALMDYLEQKLFQGRNRHHDD